MIERSHALLGLPADWRLGIVPASDTGAIEMAMWSLLGARPVDVLAWESFGQDWVTDVTKQLRLDARVLDGAVRRAARSRRRSTSRATWSSPGTAPPRACACRTATGSRATARASRSATPPRPSSRWTSPGRSSTSSPGRGRRCSAARPRTACSRSRRARSRASRAFTPPWPLPKIFRLTKKGKLDAGALRGLDHQHAVDAVRRGRARRARLGRARSGGLRGADPRARRRTSPRSPPGSSARRGSTFLARDPATRSCTSICLADRRPVVRGARRRRARRRSSRSWSALLEKEGVASTSPAIATRRPACASGAAPPSSARTSRRCCPGSTGPGAKRGRSEGC